MIQPQKRTFKNSHRNTDFIVRHFTRVVYYEMEFPNMVELLIPFERMRESHEINSSNFNSTRLKLI